MSPKITSRNKHSSLSRPAVVDEVRVVNVPPGPFSFDVCRRFQKLLGQGALGEERDEELDALVGPFLIVAL